MESEDPYQAMNDQADLGRRLERTNEQTTQTQYTPQTSCHSSFLSFVQSFFHYYVWLCNSEV